MTVFISLVYSTNVCIYHTSYWTGPSLLIGDLWSKSISLFWPTIALFFFSSSVSIINRPGVAGAVLQTTLSLINWVILCGNIFHTLPLPNRKSLSCVTCHVSHVVCHISCVTCHVSHVMCHISCVTCHVSHVMSCFGGRGMSKLNTNTERRFFVFS